MSAHDASFRAMAWSHNQNYLLTCDASGNIKYWTPSIAPVQSLDSHNKQAIHALSFSPSDTKFVSCGDDATVRIWDWASHSEERIMEGHGWDVKTVDWHPRSSVVASGSKDNLVKLWDPRGANCLSTLYGHKNTVTKVAWNNNGNWLLTASRDQLIKLYDIRAMKELTSLKGHHKEVTSLAWHPLCESVFASGGMVRACAVTACHAVLFFCFKFDSSVFTHKDLLCLQNQSSVATARMAHSSFGTWAPRGLKNLVPRSRTLTTWPFGICNGILRATCLPRAPTIGRPNSGPATGWAARSAYPKRAMVRRLRFSMTKLNWAIT